MRQRMGMIILALVADLVSGCERPPLTENGVVRVIGGVGLGPGEFSYPRALAGGGDGPVFVVDKAGRVQRFSENGDFETQWRMPEIARGKPVGLTKHADGRLLVADTHYHRVMVMDEDGAVLTSFGSLGNGDGEFQLPTDVAVDAQGFIYVSEYGGNDRISKWSSEFEFLGSFGEQPIEGHRLSRPAAIAIDDEQTLWVADACNHRIVRFSLTGEVLGTFGSHGREPGRLRYPYDIDVSPQGTLLVCEYGGDRIQWFTKEGESLRVWGRSGRAPGELSAPWGAAYGPGGRVFVVDSLNHRVQIVEP